MSRGNPKRQSLREMNEKQSGQGSGYHLSDGVRNFLLGVLAWQSLAGLFLVAGWDVLFDTWPGFKFTLGVFVVIMPLIAILFIMILYDREG